MITPTPYPQLEKEVEERFDELFDIAEDETKESQRENIKSLFLSSLKKAYEAGVIHQSLVSSDSYDEGKKEGAREVVADIKYRLGDSRTIDKVLSEYLKEK